jgi:hypothetical protein
MRCDREADRRRVWEVFVVGRWVQSGTEFIEDEGELTVNHCR